MQPKKRYSEGIFRNARSVPVFGNQTTQDYLTLVELDGITFASSLLIFSPNFETNGF